MAWWFALMAVAAGTENTIQRHVGWLLQPSCYFFLRCSRTDVNKFATPKFYTLHPPVCEKSGVCMRGNVAAMAVAAVTVAVAVTAIQSDL